MNFDNATIIQIPHETTTMKTVETDDDSKSANVLCHPVETKTIRDSEVLVDTKDIQQNEKLPKKVVNKSVHESLESCNINVASKDDTTTEYKKEDTTEDFADLTISEKEILAIVGEEVEEELIITEANKERKLSVPSLNVVSKSNVTQVNRNDM